MDTNGATFTKWLVGDGPEMVGVAGGAVGDGAFSGRVLEMVPGDPTTMIRAVYRLAGPTHDFTALMYVEQTGTHRHFVGRGHRRLVQGELGPRRVRRDPARA